MNSRIHQPRALVPAHRPPIVDPSTIAQPKLQSGQHGTQDSERERHADPNGHAPEREPRVPPALRPVAQSGHGRGVVGLPPEGVQPVAPVGEAGVEAVDVGRGGGLGGMGVVVPVEAVGVGEEVGEVGVQVVLGHFAGKDRLGRGEGGPRGDAGGEEEVDGEKRFAEEEGREATSVMWLVYVCSCICICIVAI